MLIEGFLLFFMFYPIILFSHVAVRKKVKVAKYYHFLFFGVDVKKATISSYCLFFSLLFICGYFVTKNTLFFFSMFENKVFFSGPFIAKKASSLELTINNDF